MEKNTKLPKKKYLKRTFPYRNKKNIWEKSRKKPNIFADVPRLERYL